MKKTLFAIFAWLPAFPAGAHHPLQGMPMETFAHGLLSGIGHPLFGFDHLFFVILVGIAALFTARRLLAPAAYIATMLAGCLVASLWVAVPASEMMVALSLLVLGSALLGGFSLGLHATLTIFAAFGLFHGSAFGATLAAQEAGFGFQVLIGYLFGLGITQYTIALAAGWFFNDILRAGGPRSMQPRLAGAMVAGAGLYLTLENIEGPLLRALFG